MYKIELDNKNELHIKLFEFLENNKSVSVELLDKINNFFITVELDNKTINIPFEYILINTNRKLKGIPYINFEFSCSSKQKKLCKNSKYCYSLRDQKLFKNNNYKILLNVLFIELVQYYFYLDKKELFNNLVNYLNQFKLIRFNCNNDLNNILNVDFLSQLSLKLPNSIIAGYTNRYDLIKDNNALKQLNKPKNLIINGSNYLLDNNYYVTTNLKLYCNTNYYCLGSCKNCLKCFKAAEKNIYCLLHGNINLIDSAFNTAENRKFLIEFFNNNFNYLDLKEKDLKVNKGLLSSLNKFLRQHKIYYEYQFKNYNELTTFIKAFKGSVINE